MEYTIGNIKISSIIELAQVGDVIQDIIPKAVPSAVKKLGLSEDYADENGRLKANVQAYLIQTPEYNILVDAGNGNHKVRKDFAEWGSLETNFLEKFSNLCKVEEVDIVINTHLHFDHIGWNTSLHNGEWRPTFPNAEYILVEDEYNYWSSNPESEMEDDLRGVVDSVEPVIQSGQASLVSPSYQVCEQVKIRPAFGHTSYHVAVEVKSDNQTIVIGGDMIYHPCQVLNPTWTADSDHNPQQVINTRLKYFKEITENKSLLMGMHFEGAIEIRESQDGYMIKE